MNMINNFVIGDVNTKMKDEEIIYFLSLNTFFLYIFILNVNIMFIHFNSN